MIVIVKLRKYRMRYICILSQEILQEKASVVNDEGEDEEEDAYNILLF